MHLEQKFEAGKFAVIAEMEPPKGIDVSDMVNAAQRVKGDVDAFMVPEMSNAVMRMSSLGASVILQNKGLETIMQVNCRDRNRIALQADLLAANSCGIKNVMAVAGQDPSFGDHQQARAVYDIDLPELLKMIRTLQTGRDMAGIELKGAPVFLTGAAINFGVGKSPELEIEEMNRKIEAGADFFVTPPLFDLSGIAPFIKRVDLEKIRIIPTVLLLKSLGMARYIARNVEEADVPDALITRLQKAPEKTRECIGIAAEMVGRLKAEGFAGVLISTRGWENRLPDILQKI